MRAMKWARWMALSAIGFAAAVPGQHANGPPESFVPLIQALVNEDLTQAQVLLEENVTQVNDLDVITPLYAAQEYVRSSRTRHAMLQKLLKAGALPDGPTQDGSTVLMLAAYQGDVRSAQLLLEYGADPLRVNNQGQNAITAAQHGRHDEMAEMLREVVGEAGLRRMATASSVVRDEL